MKDYGYLDRGTLIQVGTILKIGNELKEVTSFTRRPFIHFGREYISFVLEAGGEEFDKQDLEDMLDKKTLKIYNES
jgi:hypothetical protein